VSKARKKRSLAAAFGTESCGGDLAPLGPAAAVPAPTTREQELEMIPGGRDGKLVPGESSVNMTFTVTAKERYLWTLELKRRGVSAVSVLRQAMNELLDEGGT
jgi:hypothetical protein